MQGGIIAGDYVMPEDAHTELAFGKVGSNFGLQLRQDADCSSCYIFGTSHRDSSCKRCTSRRKAFPLNSQVGGAALAPRHYPIVCIVAVHEGAHQRVVTLQCLWAEAQQHIQKGCLAQEEADSMASKSARRAQLTYIGMLYPGEEKRQQRQKWYLKNSASVVCQQKLLERLKTKACLSRQGCCPVRGCWYVLLLVVNVISTYCIDKAQHYLVWQRHSC